MAVSIIVPAYNSARLLGECLSALAASTEPPHEVVVVDDASTDETAEVAAAMGARVVRRVANGGPAAARNLGAASASGDVLFFVDADVAVAPDAVGRVAATLAGASELAAVFGSYDAQPRAPGVVSQYRNLLHHFVHQHGNHEAFTFWAGCGAVRRAVFTAVGGFDERPVRHFIEDIDLGYRIRRAGYRIRLDKALRGTHLKRWTLSAMLRTDLCHRAVPWARLIRETNTDPADLNLTTAQRASVALVGVAGLALALAPWHHALAVAAAIALLVVLGLNRTLYAFFYRQRGLGFALTCVPLHLLYFCCSGLGFAYARITPSGRTWANRTVSPA